MAEILKITRFVYRDTFILEAVRDKTVLHLGCIGETDSQIEVKLQRVYTLLHHKVEQKASEVFGIDIDSEAIKLYTEKLGKKNLLFGDVEHLERVSLNRSFDVILFTDLMEHLSNPGLVLEGIKRFMKPKLTEVIISVPHSFGLPNYIRYILGRFKEGNQHIAMYNSANLKNLLERHGFQIVELISAYERLPKGIWKFFYLLPLIILKLLPKFGGTLVVLAKLKDN